MSNEKDALTLSSLSTSTAGTELARCTRRDRRAQIDIEPACWRRLTGGELARPASATAAVDGTASDGIVVDDESDAAVRGDRVVAALAPRFELLLRVNVPPTGAITPAPAIRRRCAIEHRRQREERGGERRRPAGVRARRDATLVRHSRAQGWRRAA